MLAEPLPGTVGHAACKLAFALDALVDALMGAAREGLDAPLAALRRIPLPFRRRGGEA
jgi:hypothetical protein